MLKKKLDRDIPLDLLAQLNKGIRYDTFTVRKYGEVMRTILEHRLVVLGPYLTHVRVGSRGQKIATNFGRSIVVHKKRDALACDVGYPDIVEYMGVVEWNFSGD